MIPGGKWATKINEYTGKGKLHHKYKRFFLFKFP